MQAVNYSTNFKSGIFTRLGNNAVPLNFDLVEKTLGLKQSNKIFARLPVNTCIENHLLTSLSDENLITLLPFMESVNLSAGQQLYDAGDEIDYIYFPETAVISEFQLMEDGRSCVTAMIGSSGALGVNCSITSQPSLNFVQVLIKGRAFRLNSRIFNERMSQDCSFQRCFMSFLNDYIRQLSQKVVCTCHHDAEQRFASCLLEIQSLLKSEKLLLTQECLSSILGIHRPSVTKIALKLKEIGIIKYERGIIIIKDKLKLERISCECSKL